MRPWLSYLALLLLAACGATADQAWKPAVYPSEKLNAAAISVPLADAREATVERTFHVPWMTFPWQGESKQIALQEDARAILNARAQQLLGQGATALAFETRIVSGVAGWDAHALAEEEFAEVELEVRCSTSPGGIWLASSTGYASVHLHSADTNDEAPIAWFDAAVIRAFEQAITRPLFVQLINRALCDTGQGPCAATQTLSAALR